MHYYIANPMSHLIVAMKKLSKGLYETRVKSLKGQEFRLIGKTFNKMASQIQQDIRNEKEAQLKRQQLMTAIEHSGETIKILDSDGHIEYVNPSFEKITGYTQEEVLGEKIDTFIIEESCGQNIDKGFIYHILKDLDKNIRYIFYIFLPTASFLIMNFLANTVDIRLNEKNGGPNHNYL